ncbi:MAG: SDR family oxidoreductase [Verrucomicrobiota bacterium]|nr:SDR family oxidoreductase [Verrucomicrobiota bacterium]
MSLPTLPRRTALVTGATRGIGRELVLQLTAQGVEVYATGRDTELLVQLCKETRCRGNTADLANPAEVLALYQTACETLRGAPDFLINNAGFNNRKAALAESSLEEFDLQYAINLRAPYLLCREAMRDMAKRKSGHIVNVISTCALFANETMGVYTTMKSGLRGLTGVLIKEARQHGVKVTGVYPGGTDTEFRSNHRPDYMKASSAAAMIVQVLMAPADVVVHELTFRPLVESNF